MRRTMKKTGLALVLICGLTFAMTACGEEPENDYVGKWKCTAVKFIITAAELAEAAPELYDDLTPAVIDEMDITDTADDHSSLVIQNGGKAKIKLKSFIVTKTVKGTWNYDENNPAELTVTAEDGSVTTLHRNNDGTVYVSEYVNGSEYHYIFTKKITAFSKAHEGGFFEEENTNEEGNVMNKIYPLIFLLIAVVIAAALAGCQSSAKGNEEDIPVLATIDGEVFLYDRETLFFRDFTLYPKDPAEALPENIPAFNNYGEMALGYELLWREAEASGFEISKGQAEKDKEFFYRLLTDGELRKSAFDGEENLNRYNELIGSVKENHHLKSDKELADYGYPYFKKGSYASHFFVKCHTERIGNSFDREKNRVFWDELYGELKEKYHVEYVMDF